MIFHDSATDLADTLRSLAHEATEAVMHDCQMTGYALGVLVTKVNQLADVLDGALDSDPSAEPTIDAERPTHHEPMRIRNEYVPQQVEDEVWS